MSHTTILVGSTEYLLASVPATVAGTAINPTSDPVAVAARALNDYSAYVWNTAAWETDATTDPDTYYARLLIGTGGLVLTAGLYNVYVKVTDNPEVPILHRGVLYMAAG